MLRSAAWPVAAPNDPPMGGRDGACRPPLVAHCCLALDPHSSTPAIRIARRHTRLVRAVFLLETAQFILKLELREIAAQLQQPALELLLRGRLLRLRFLRFLKPHA